MKQKTILSLLLIVGIIGIAGVWKTRYQLGYNQGFDDGIFDGNNTGFIVGLETGTNNGYNDGYNEGFNFGKDIGNVKGFSTGYETGYLEGELEGYADGYEEGESIGSYEGYYDGIEYCSRLSMLRDPTNEEALQFIENDDTNELYESDQTLSNNFFLSRIRKNAANKGFRCIWVQVEMYGNDMYFCAFNTTDSGMLYFNYRFDLIHELEIGKQCYDDRYLEPEFDDTITKIIHIY